MFRDTLAKLLEECFEKRSDLYLICLEILESNKIRIIIDGDSGVLIQDCVYVSRFIEHKLESEEEDFSLEVSSAGATSPIVYQRQYPKHLGRTLKVLTFEKEKYEAVLAAANEKNIVLEWKVREPKPIGRGKVTVHKKIKIPYQDIEKAQVKLVF